MSYFEDQKIADQVLAQKVGLPAATLVQDFRADRNVNLLDEANLLGEVDITAAGIVEGDAVRYFLLPVHGVSPGSRRAARLRLLDLAGRDTAAVAHRPVLRPISHEDPQVLVLLVFELAGAEAAPNSLADLRLTEVGTGFDGTLVHVSGALLRRTVWGGQAGGVFSEAVAEMVGADRAGSVPLMSPNPKRRAIPETSHLSAAARTQFMLGVAFVAAGLCLALVGGKIMGQTASQAPAVRLTVSKVQTKSYLSFFSPIASQEELWAESVPNRPTRETPLMDAVADTLGRWAGHLSRIRSRR